MRKAKTEKNNTSQIKSFVESVAPKIKELKYGNADQEFTIMVYPVLPFTKRMEMVREIVDGVFMGNKDNVNSYAPEYLSFIRRYTVIKYFTDLVLPTKLDDMWLILNYTPIYNDVVDIVGSTDVQDILDAADKAIETYRQYLTAKTDSNLLINKVGDVLRDFEQRIPQEYLDEIALKIKEMPNGTSILDLMGSLIGNKDVKANI